MSIRVALHHTTIYGYGRPVQLAPHVVRLRPAPHCRTPILAYSLRVRPEAHFLNWQQDPFGNYQARLVFPELTDELAVEVDLIAEMTVINPFDFFVEESFETYPFAYAPGLLRDLAPYLAFAPVGPRFVAFVEKLRAKALRPGRGINDVLVDINRTVERSLRYDIRMEPGVFPPEETLERGHGSCRDFAWLLVQVLRHLGLAARFASGYSVQLKADEKPLVGPAGVGHDATDLHAWAEVFLPGAGWVGLDATSGLLTGEGHIPLACTPDPDTAAAVTGSFNWTKRGEHDRVDERFSFSMSVHRVEETPRVTLPYSDEQWRAIDVLGHTVDAKLEAADVRLTMGGEPTFVADADPEAPEWNIAALGPTKRRYATELTRCLYDRFTPGALLHEGQGKWYPGEPLPRWAMSCYFRKDHQPIWQDRSLFARAETGTATERDAHAFVAALSSRLGVDPAFAIAGHEDAFYHLWRERRLPVNVDPFDSRLEDEVERARLARIFERGLDAVVGYVLPLRRAPSAGGNDFGAPQAERRWESGPWFVRTERLYLTPGDSPMGYRLPQDGLPWVAPSDFPHVHEPDPFAPREPLPPRERFGRPSDAGSPEPTLQMPGAGQIPPTGGEASASARDASPQRAPLPPARGQSAPYLIRTALCVEPRGGVLHVFMPPVAALEHYLDLVAAVEDTASAQHQSVRIEGYPPPSDPRLGRLQVTPDPGVIEVNIHPAANWPELVDHTLGVYEDARTTGLRAEKFMIDGRHTGSGGGNHVVLGGPTPADSPLLRRPHLLSSLVSYWLNHPSLSYLFSGLFVGPTSQAPRADEARNDSLYELEIAMSELDRLGGSAPRSAASALPPTFLPPSPPPWLVDRLFRNLLTDVTGNTHRAEFCIDKLYSPDGPAGRQGLLELRSFEMPPHARMSLVQQLVVRALVARFFDDPYREPPVRWGTELHDRFMLPHFVKQDFDDVLAELARHGSVFENTWFDPHYEFRFPLLGKVEGRDAIVFELRQAIEPWHVLGEEQSSGGTARYVDSSLERVEVKVRGINPQRHAVLCNGQRVPLHPTGTNGEHIAGVRYRAWQPPSALHPTIGIHAPLVFDLVDRWSERPILAATYHVSHPGGRSEQALPRNGLEAESRRAARFFRFGHSPGRAVIAPAEPTRELPFTLDLRR